MADAFIVHGLASKPLLSGTLRVGGAKNGALPVMAAALTMEGETALANVPDIADVRSMLSLIEGLGGYGECKDGMCSIRTKDALGTVLDRDVAKRLRASVLLTGAVLARHGKVTFPHPGGCVLGSRPIDLFLDGFKTLGCAASERAEEYTLNAPPEGLTGGTIFFRVPSVTATETFMIAGTRAIAPVTLENAAMEPEIVSLADFLMQSGARIEGAGTPTIIIHPSHLEPPHEPFCIIPDRIEAGSFLILGALLGKHIKVAGVEPGHLTALMETLKAMGVAVETSGKTLSVSRPDTLAPTAVRTHEYPGFPTDLQAPMAVLLTQASGESSILETVFDGRLNYAAELVRMGADIQVVNPHKALIKGPSALKARDIDGPDIRAGLAFLLAAAVADGESRIGNAHLIDRGY
ncbi:MAG: UDP-N-acetylglucosamine 1-carboxyvinyltransferase, partial [Candidatus Paceibacteria bacterium]